MTDQQGSSVCPRCQGEYRSPSALTTHTATCDGTDRTRRKRSRYREVFFATYGFGPYPCAHCGEGVSFDDVHVHHADENEKNDAVENLVAMHQQCHTQKHMSTYWTGKSHSAEHRQKVSEAKRGTTHSTETKQKLSEIAKQRPPASEETRAKISAGNKGRKRSPETRARLSEAMRKRHAARRALQEGGDAT
jgi:hypothetical protein